MVGADVGVVTDSFDVDVRPRLIGVEPKTGEGGVCVSCVDGTNAGVVVDSFDADARPRLIGVEPKTGEGGVYVSRVIGEGGVN